jgi:hypothetical protein
MRNFHSILQLKWCKTLLIAMHIPLVFSCFAVGAKNDSTEVDDIRFSIYPVIGYQPETRFIFGAISFLVYGEEEGGDSEYYRPSTISPYILYTLNQQMLIAIDFDHFFPKGYFLALKPRYYKYPDFFYGIGNDNRIEDEEVYVNRFERLDGSFMKFVNQRLAVGLKFDIQNNHLSDFEEEGQIISDDIFGVNGGLNVGLGPTLQVDSRDNILYPSRGVFALAEITMYRQGLGGDFTYTNFILDLRKFLSIKNEKNILAFQLAGNFTSGKVPFYKLPKVGGDSRLRGIENANLYIDRQSFWMQAEYRRKLFWRLGAVAFVGFGDVAPNLADFRPDEFKYVIGLGGRFQPIKSEKLNARLDLGIGRGGQYAFYLSIKEAF